MSLSSERGRLPAWLRLLPYSLVVAVIASVVVNAARSTGDDQAVPPGSSLPEPATSSTVSPGGSEISGSSTTTWSETSVTTSLPTPGFGPNCDERTGRVRLPIASAPPCIQPWLGGDAGATAGGVTSTEIVVAVYETQVNPAMRGVLAGMGASIDSPQSAQARDDYGTVFESVTETYGRSVRFVPLPASGLPTDVVAARNDAIRAAEDIGAFAVLGGPVQTTAFAEELAARGVVCLSCATAPSVALTTALEPYVVSVAMAPDQLAAHLAEFVVGQLAGRPASRAGGALATEPRSFGLVSVERGGGPGTGSFDLAAELEARGVELTEVVSYASDPTAANDQAATMVLRLKDAGVTSVLVSADPITLGPLTRAATAQDWYPEWILSGALLADSTFIGRTYDQRQWASAFGLTTRPVPRDPSAGSDAAVALYEWYFGTAPPIENSQATAIVASLSLLYGALTLAGPELTAESFRDGLFQIDVPSSGPWEPSITFGSAVWPYADYFGVDDVTLIWWDPEAEAVDELGRSGRGAFRFVDGGRRYLPGAWPSAPFSPSPDDPLRLEVTGAPTPQYDPPPTAPSEG